MTIYTCKIINSLPHVVAEGSLDNLNNDFVTGDFTPGTIYQSMALEPDVGLGSTLFLTATSGSTLLSIFGAPLSYTVDEWCGVELDTGEWFWSLVESVNNAGGTVTLRDQLPSQASAGSQVVGQHEAQGATLWNTIEDFKYPKWDEITSNTDFLRTAEIPYNNYLFVPSDKLIADIGSYLASTREATNFNVIDSTGREYAFTSENDLADFTYLISGYVDNLIKGQGTLLQQVWEAANTQLAMDAIVDNRTSTVPSLTELGFPFVRYNDNTENGITVTSPGAISGASIRLNNSSDIPRVVLSYSEDTDTALFSSIVDATLGSSGNLTVVGDTILLSSNETNNEAIKLESNTGGDASVFVLSATPEGTTTGDPGDLAVDVTNGDLYLKESGTATNTGWISIKGGPSVIMFGDGQVQSSTTTRYLTPGYDAGAAPTVATRYPCPRDGIIRNMAVSVRSGNGNGNDIVYTLRVNSVASALSVTMASTDLDGSGTADVVVSEGDILDIEVTKASGIGSSPQDIIATLNLV